MALHVRLELFTHKGNPLEGHITLISINPKRSQVSILNETRLRLPLIPPSKRQRQASIFQ